jgi:type I pantothenate kinase
VTAWVQAVVEVAERLGASLAGRPRPHLIGVSGGVAAGKSTLAADLAAVFADRGRDTAVLCTDSFLLPNATLAVMGLTMRKGFPETFDAAALARTLDDLLAGATAVRVPVYDHATYDVVPGSTSAIAGADVVIVEGVNALQPPAVERLHAAIYLEAPEEQVFGWFRDRFLSLAAAGRTDPGSFYATFAAMGDAEVGAVARQVWDAVNGPNLREHIGPSVSAATIVIEKAPDHSVVRIRAG